jgi:hypothetical protein
MNRIMISGLFVVALTATIAEPQVTGFWKLRTLRTRQAIPAAEMHQLYVWIAALTCARHPQKLVQFATKWRATGRTLGQRFSCAPCISYLQERKDLGRTGRGRQWAEAVSQCLATGR